MMKKLLSVLFFTCLVFTAACTEIDIEEPLSSSSELQSESFDSNAYSAEGSSAVDQSGADGEDSAVFAESTPDSEVSEESDFKEVTSVTTYNYEYAVKLSDEEERCINAGEGGEYLILVNKDNKLPDDYEPSGLVDIRDTRSDRAAEKMVDVAETALHAFLNEAAFYGYDDITVTSGYRSIAKQSSLFNYYVSQEMAKGKDETSAIAAASVYSAYPGTSEHHTGLCVDMHNLPAASQSFGSSDAAKWLAANAHRFGFILRFPQDKEDITTYMWEPWHFRFVGIHHATAIYEDGLCLEEYIELLDDALSGGQVRYELAG